MTKVVVIFFFLEGRFIIWPVLNRSVVRGKLLNVVVIKKLLFFISLFFFFTKIAYVAFSVPEKFNYGCVNDGNNTFRTNQSKFDHLKRTHFTFFFFLTGKTRVNPSHFLPKHVEPKIVDKTVIDIFKFLLVRSNGRCRGAKKGVD